MTLIISSIDFFAVCAFGFIWYEREDTIDNMILLNFSGYILLIAETNERIIR